MKGVAIRVSTQEGRLDTQTLKPETWLMNRPPPYFPQNQLSPPDENRYRKFKLLVGAAIVVLISIVAGIGIGIYYLIAWFFD
jgi:hypothetical protein